MNKRAHRQALEAKRGDLSRHAGCGHPVDDLTDAECIAIDAAYDRSKYDPAEQRRQEHMHLQDQQRMLRTLGNAL